MRLNPLWLLAIFFLLPGLGALFAPLLILFAFVVLGAFGGGATALLARVPLQLWTLLKSSRARGNCALANAVCHVLGERRGGSFVSSVSETGFFLSGAGDEGVVYEAAGQALARLKSGEAPLRIDPSSPFFRSAAALCAGVATMLVLLPLLAASAVVPAVAVGYFAGPHLSPRLQKILLGGAGVRGLSIVSVVRRTRAVSFAGGRLTRNEFGVEVTTSSDGVLEAEIVDE